jgi:RecA DNA recombination protein
MSAPARSLATQFRLLKPSLPYLLPTPPSVESTASEAVQRLRSGFDPAFSRQISSGTELLRSLNRQRREDVLPTSIEQIDALLDGGIARGKTIEIAGRGARYSVVVATLAAATSLGEAAALIDLGGAFDPQIGEAAGIDLHRMLWVRPQTLKQAVAAAEMLIATGFQLVIIDAGLPKLRGRVPDAAWVRLARAAEAHGTALVISSPYPLTGTTSEAMLRSEWPRGQWRNGLLTAVVTTMVLEKHRRKRPGQSIKTTFACADALTANGERQTASK